MKTRTGFVSNSSSSSFVANTDLKFSKSVTAELPNGASVGVIGLDEEEKVNNWWDFAWDGWNGETQTQEGFDDIP